MGLNNDFEQDSSGAEMWKGYIVPQTRGQRIREFSWEDRLPTDRRGDGENSCGNAALRVTIATLWSPGTAPGTERVPKRNLSDSTWMFRLLI